MAMDEITGRKVDQVPYPNLHKVADLTYGELYVVDIDSQGKPCAVLLTHPEQLPFDYFPQKNTLFDPTTTVFYEQNTIIDVISFLLDEVHTLRQAKPEYSQYNQRQLSALPVQLAADD
ncbi:MAG: hypothetical protein DYG89_26130 [Caldilinea sp. CFX5]|nr:hypothetical protein [Caldilinea sp. CFX5]